MQKKFGQNFLINGAAREKLIENLNVQEGMSVWEIGPGLGAMTSGILEKGANLTVFEIDRGFASLISQYFSEYSQKDRFHLVEGDVIKTWKGQLEKGLPERLFGNLPYNIAATIIADTIEEGIRFDSCVFTVQKEVAQRMAAKAGSEDYSSFSVLCQWAYDVKAILDLNGGNFWPKPNVASRAVLFTKKADWPNCKNPKAFVKLQRALFSSRRKNVRNNLSNYLKNNDLALAYLEKAGIAAEKRAEVLSIEELLHLSDVIEGGL
ncbi:MAG: 16S rRNA (adenine(1518)-N(6)/adenine(1519)-N(6))-dimethyltransferase RsmA [Treponema sp.]|nr:16S rRNA (adenine(1518)-N(6)/adenine(1519)-N(6))-dimethyltransferase RsmA [Treponema sp.]